MNCIFQTWHGHRTSEVIASRENFARYARRIGAHHVWDENARFTSSLTREFAYFDRFRPCLDRTFDVWENLLYVDCDVFTITGLEESIFDHALGHVSVCPEPHQPALRQFRTRQHINGRNQFRTRQHINGRNDEIWADRLRRRWGMIMPRDDQGRLLVYNAGVILWTRTGRHRFREVIEDLFTIGTYQQEMRPMGQFYARDQNYLHAICCSGLVDFHELSRDWNRQIHPVDDGSIYDQRDENTKFVHVQLKNMADRSAAEIERIVNAHRFHGAGWS